MFEMQFCGIGRRRLAFCATGCLLPRPVQRHGHFGLVGLRVLAARQLDTGQADQADGQHLRPQKIQADLSVTALSQNAKQVDAALTPHVGGARHQALHAAGSNGHGKGRAPDVYRLAGGP